MGMTTLLQMHPADSPGSVEHTMRLGGDAEPPAIVLQINDPENATVIISSFPGQTGQPLTILESAHRFLQLMTDNVGDILRIQKERDGEDMKYVGKADQEEWCEDCQTHHAPGKAPRPSMKDEPTGEGRLVTTAGVVIDGEGVPGEEYKELTPDLLGILTDLIDELPISDDSKAEMRKTLGQVQGINMPVTYLTKEELEADALAHMDDIRLPLSPDETEEAYWDDVQHAHVGERMAFGMGFQVGVTTGQNVTQGKLPVRTRRGEKE